MVSTAKFLACSAPFTAEFISSEFIPSQRARKHVITIRKVKQVGVKMSTKTVQGLTVALDEQCSFFNSEQGVFGLLCLDNE